MIGIHIVIKRENSTEPFTEMLNQILHGFSLHVQWVRLRVKANTC